MKIEKKEKKRSFFDLLMKTSFPLLLLFAFVLFTLVAIACYFFYIYLIEPFPHGYFGPKFINGTLFFQDPSDFFMDFYNINFMVMDGNPYFVEGDKGGGSSYPPLILAIAKLFQLVGGTAENARALRITPRGILSGVLYALVFLAGFTVLMLAWGKRNGLQKKESALLFVALLFSAPSLYLLDRGNYLTFALLFSGFFLLWRKDELAWKRELSLVSLAMAVGCKLYPAIFSFLLLREKKWKEFLRTVLYSACFGFLPFLFFTYGMKNVIFFLENLTKFSSEAYSFVAPDGIRYSTGTANDISASNLITVVTLWLTNCSFFDLPSWVSIVGKVLLALSVVLTIGGIFLTKEDEDVVLFACGAIILIPSPNFVYTNTFMIFPFLAFLIKSKKNVSSIVSYLLFLCILLPMDLGYLLQKWSHGLQHGYALVNFVQALSVLTLCVYRFVLALVQRIGVFHGTMQTSVS